VGNPLPALGGPAKVGGRALGRGRRGFGRGGGLRGRSRRRGRGGAAGQPDGQNKNRPGDPDRTERREPAGRPGNRTERPGCPVRRVRRETRRGHWCEPVVDRMKGMRAEMRGKGEPPRRAAG
jgi:hypothetical protein